MPTLVSGNFLTHQSGRIRLRDLGKFPTNVHIYSIRIHIFLEICQNTNPMTHRNGMRAGDSEHIRSYIHTRANTRRIGMRRMLLEANRSLASCREVWVNSQVNSQEYTYIHERIYITNSNISERIMTHTCNSI